MQKFFQAPISGFIRVAGWIVRHVNERAAYRIGRMLITLVLLPQHSRRMDNLQKVFAPLGWSDGQLEKLSRENVRYCSDFIIEVIRLATLSSVELEPRTICHGEHHLKDALDKGQGVFLLGSHLGNWWYGRALFASKGYRFANVSNRMPVAALEIFLQEVRARFGIQTTYVGEGGKTSAEDAIRHNGIFSMLIDITTPQREAQSEWIPLCQSAIYIDVGPAKLVRDHPRTPVLWLCAKRIGRGRYEFHLSPIELHERNISAQHVLLTQEWLDRLYNELLEHPEQWWHWSYVKLRKKSELKV